LAKIFAIEKMKNKRIQVIAMTATISQLEVYKKWLNSAMYENKSRPTSLTEYVLCEGKLLNSSFNELLVIPLVNNNEAVIYTKTIGCHTSKCI